MNNKKKWMPVREHKGKSILDFLDNYVVVDLETTGLDPIYDEIIEIAAVRVENNLIVDEYKSFVKPVQPISDFITDLTGITNDMIKNAPPISEVLPEFLSFVGNTVVVAHNANFNINFIYDNCLKLNPAVYFKNDYLDTMRLSRRLFKNIIRHRLIDLVELFDIEGEITHRAISNVINTKNCYEHMIDYINKHNIEFRFIKKYKIKVGLSAMA